MSEPRDEPPVPPERNPHPRITTYTYDAGMILRGVGSPGEAPDGPAKTPVVRPGYTVDYEPARHVIRITDRAGKTSEFDDRPVKYLMMVRNPRTRALEPVMVCGEPQFFYLSREVER
jgi:hypothetical protein